MFRKSILVTAICALSATLHAETFYPAWSRLYTPTGDASQFARAVAVDSHGNVFVAGHKDVAASKQLYVIKYDALNGNRLWERTIEAVGTNQVLANAITVDKFDDCVVAGSVSVNGQIDYYTHKFNGATGGDSWNQGGARYYNGTASGQDVAAKVVTDSNGDVIVTGRSAGNGSGTDFVTLKYARQSGNPVGAVDRYSAVNGTLNDFPAALAVDSANNIIVGGVAATDNSTQRFAVRKLNANLGLVWTITPVNLGGEGGVTGLAVDSVDNIVATGRAKNASNQFGYYTTKLNKTNGAVLWKTGVAAPASQTDFGDIRPEPVGVVIGPDDQPIVSGSLRDAGGNYYIQTVKYKSAGAGDAAVLAWSDLTPDRGAAAGGNTFANALAVDADSNAIVIGTTRNAAGTDDIYVAKYSAGTGTRTYSNFFDGPAKKADFGVGVAVDGLGNIVLLGSVDDNKGNGPGVTYDEFATIKLNRFIAYTGDKYTDATEAPANATFAQSSAPALADDGTVVVNTILAAGTKKTKAIMYQGPGGGTSFVAVQGQSAPGSLGGDTVGNWVSFSDPIMAPEGTFAFGAKISGPAAKANGLWANFGAGLRLVLQQGTPLPGLNPAANVSTVLSYSMHNSDLLAVVKVSGPAATNMALVRAADNNTKTVLLRTGQAGLTLGGTAHTVKSFTVLSAAPGSPGDGRWDADGSVIVRVVATETANPKVSREAVVRINTQTAALAVLNSTGASASQVANNATSKSFGLPATAENGTFYAYALTANLMGTQVTSTNDQSLAFSFGGGAPTTIAREGSPSADASLNGAVYATFSDPQIAAAGFSPRTLFQGTFKAGGVTKANNQALMYGVAGNVASIQHLARTMDFAAQPLTDEGGASEPLTRYTAFTAHALAGGPSALPVFVAQLDGAATAKNNTALFARSSSGAIRRLLRTGDDLGGNIVKSFTLLNSGAKAFGAARSFNEAGALVVQLKFTNGRTALLALNIP